MLKGKFVSISVVLCVLTSSPFAYAQVVQQVLDTDAASVTTLRDPWEAVLDSNGNLYIAGYSSNNVLKITPGGIVTEVLTASGDGEGHTLDRPISLALDSSDNLYVAGYGSHNAFKIDDSGSISVLITSTSGPFSVQHPNKIYADSQDNIYLVGTVSNNVLKISAGGEVEQLIDSSGDGIDQLISPRDISVDSMGDVYLIADGDVRNSSGVVLFKVDNTGTITPVLRRPGFGIPSGLAIDKADNLFIADGLFGQIWQVDDDLSTALFTPSGGLDVEVVQRMEFDDANSLYIADSLDSYVKKIAADGSVVTLIDVSGDGENPFNSPLGLAIGQNGVIYTAGLTSNNVFRISPLPVLSDATYDVLNDILTINGINIPWVAGPDNDIDLSKISVLLRNQDTNTTSSHSLDNVMEIDTFNSEQIKIDVSLLEDATEKSDFFSDVIFNRNGSNNLAGDLYQILVEDNWAKSIPFSHNIAPAENLNVVVINAIPGIENARFNASAGELIVQGFNFSSIADPNWTIDISKLTIQGEDKEGLPDTYTLADSTAIAIQSETTLSIQLGEQDRINVLALLSNIGNQSIDGVPYLLFLDDQWANYQKEGVNMAVSGGVEIEVTEPAESVITFASYAIDDGVLEVRGDGFLSIPGDNNDVDVSKLSILGAGYDSVPLEFSGDVDIVSSTTFRVSIADQDRQLIAALLDNNGGAANDGTPYAIVAEHGWIRALADSIDDSESDSKPLVITQLGSVIVSRPATIPPPPLSLDSEQHIFRLVGERFEIDITGGLYPLRVNIDDSSVVFAGISGTSVVGLALGSGTTSLTISDSRGQQQVVTVTSASSNPRDSLDELPSTRLRSTDSTVVSSSFKFGLAVNDDPNVSGSKQIFVGDTIELFATINPDPLHIGERGQFIAAYMGPAPSESLYFLDPYGLYEPAILDDPIPVFEYSILTHSHTFSLLGEKPVELLAIDIGLYKFFVGYKLADSDVIYYSEQAFELVVTE